MSNLCKYCELFIRSLWSVPNSNYCCLLQERDQVLADLKHKAQLVSKTFDAVDGVTCNAVQGAMYCFPKLDLPPKAVEHAKVGTTCHV